MKKNFTWSDVTLCQFDEINAILQMRIDELDKMIQILSVMTGVEYETYLDYDLPKITEELKKVYFINEKPETRFDCKGEYIIGDLNLKLTLSGQHMTAGQFIDYNNTIATNKEDYAMLCAILLVPDGKKYGEGYEVLELREKLYKEFKVVDALGVCFFFTKMLNVLYECSLHYLIKKLKKAQKKEKDKKKIQAIEQSIQKLQYHTYGNESLNKLFNIPT